ncbi:MAG: hypothetical protein ABI175_14370, partial [Polyangiales bacterium]
MKAASTARPRKMTRGVVPLSSRTKVGIDGGKRLRQTASSLRFSLGSQAPSSLQKSASRQLGLFFVQTPPMQVPSPQQSASVV